MNMLHQIITGEYTSEVTRIISIIGATVLLIVIWIKKVRNNRK